MSPHHARRLGGPSAARTKTIAGVGAAVLVSSIAAVISSTAGPASAAAPTVVTLAPVADTYVTTGAPTQNNGSEVRFQASDEPGHHKTGYLRFAVPAVSGVITQAQLVLTRDTHHLDSVVYANAVATSSWTESAMTVKNAPAVGATLDSKATNASTSTVSLNVSNAVAANSLATIAITSRSTTGFASFRSREWGAGRPQLLLTVGPAPVSTPPKTTAPVSTPPKSTPPVSTPPKSTPPISTPPVSTPPVSTPPVSTPPVSTPPVETSCVSNAKGIPSSGAYVGAAVSGTADLPTLERQAGHPLAIHRLYFEASQVTTAITAIKADLAAGRLPWVSFKMPYSWADMANGRGDAWATDLADKLAKVGGPVWLAFHHEPEGDGPIQDWVRMQQHLAPIVHAHATNVAYTIIIMSWDLFGDAQYRPDAIWPGDKYVDILGIDMYNDYASFRHGNTSTPMLDPMKYLGWFGTFAKAHHVPIALGETGYTAAAATANPHWLELEYQNLVAQGGIALSYFDSSLNSIADWTLDVPNKITSFTGLLAKSPRICR